MVLSYLLETFSGGHLLEPRQVLHATRLRGGLGVQAFLRENARGKSAIILQQLPYSVATTLCLPVASICPRRRNSRCTVHPGC